MLSVIKSLLAKEEIRLVAPIPLSRCTVTKQYLLERVGIAKGTVFMLAVPYYTTKCDDPARNISAYAVSRDYHGFFKALFDKLLPILQSEFPQNRFAGFADHSPIAEAEAAVRAGLGFWGCNHLFLTSKHSSFVFLGEIVTDACFDLPLCEERHCEACGACRRACPVGLDIAKCHSALTQKRGTLTNEEQRQLLSHGSAWGCDICQTTCPVTLRAKSAGTLYSTVPYFQKKAIPRLTANTVRAMSDEDFAARAYSWRGKAVILRNLELTEKGETT